MRVPAGFAAADFRYWTVTVAVEVVRPNSFVALSIYVVVCDGVTTTVVPRIAPICGVTS
jgi:hypothetical protein